MSPKLASIEFRNLRENEFSQVLDLCFKEGRHMGQREELNTWFQIDPTGFFVAVTEENEIVGSCVAINLSSFHGNLGMFVVKEQYRNMGIGTRIWKMGFNHLGEYRNKSLTAIPKMYNIYRDRAGFKYVANWNILLYKLDGKRLLENLSEFTKTDKTKFTNSIIDNLKNSTQTLINNRTNDECSNSIDSNSSSLNSSKENSNENLNILNIQNESTNYQKFLHNSHSSPVPDTFKKLTYCLKDITNEENVTKILNQNDTKFYKINQLINYSTLKPYHLSTIYSTNVFQSNGKSNSPSISMPSLLQNDKFNLINNNFFTQQNSLSTQQNENKRTTTNKSSNVHILPYSSYWLKKLIEYDQQLNGYDRSKIVKLSCEEANSKVRIAIIDNEIVGYSILKLGLQNVYLIAPLYANNSQIANQLLVEFVRSMNIEQLTKGLILKLPDCNQSALTLLESLGFKRQDYLSTRCFTNYVHQNKINKIFAFHSSIFSSE